MKFLFYFTGISRIYYRVLQYCSYLCSTTFFRRKKMVNHEKFFKRKIWGFFVGNGGVTNVRTFFSSFFSSSFFVVYFLVHTHTHTYTHLCFFLIFFCRCSLQHANVAMNSEDTQFSFSRYMCMNIPLLIYICFFSFLLLL